MGYHDKQVVNSGSMQCLKKRERLPSYTSDELCSMQLISSSVPQKIGHSLETHIKNHKPAESRNVWTTVNLHGRLTLMS